MSTRSSLRKHRGLTLVEVLAVCALLSSMLVGVMLGFSRSQQQLRQSEMRLQACDLADELLFSWNQDGHLVFPQTNRGGWADYPDWQWQLEEVRQETLGSVVELRLLYEDQTALKLELLANGRR